MRFTLKVKKIGNSLWVVMPNHAVEELGIKENEKLILEIPKQ